MYERSNARARAALQRSQAASWRESYRAHSTHLKTTDPRSEEYRIAYGFAMVSWDTSMHHEKMARFYDALADGRWPF